MIFEALSAFAGLAFFSLLAALGAFSSFLTGVALVEVLAAIVLAFVAVEVFVALIVFKRHVFES